MTKQAVEALRTVAVAVRATQVQQEPDINDIRDVRDTFGGETDCQYAKDVGMPEYRCAVKCQYEATPPAARLTAEVIDKEIMPVVGELVRIACRRVIDRATPFDEAEARAALRAKLMEFTK